MTTTLDVRETALETPPRAVGELLVLRLRGAQAEMGEQHGRLLRGAGGWERTQAYYRRLPQMLLFGPNRSALDGLILRFLCRPAIERYLRGMERDRPPALLERTRAFEEALGLPSADARYVSVMDVFQSLVGLAARLGALPVARRLALCCPPACSSVAVWGGASSDGALRHARNFDFPGIGTWDRAPTLVFCEPDQGVRYGFVTTRGADAPGVSAFNEAGISLFAHTRFHREAAFRGAGIVDLGHEIARRAETLADAVKIARERPVASTWGISVSSSRENRALSIETTGGRVETVEPGQGEEFLACTNHYQTPAIALDEVIPCVAFPVHSRGRWQRMRDVARTAASGGGLSAEGLCALLGDHTDPEDPGGERGPRCERAAGSVISQPITVQSIVVEPAARALRVSTGGCPAGLGPWARVPWRWDGEVGAEEIRADEGAIAVESRPESRFTSGEPARAYRRFLSACRINVEDRDPRHAMEEIERAVVLDPEEPRYRFLAGLLRMRHDDSRAALAHFERGISHEGAPFRRGNLLLWASRAADILGDRERARALRKGLAGLDHWALKEYQRVAQGEERRPFPRRKLAKIAVNFLLNDVR